MISLINVCQVHPIKTPNLFTPNKMTIILKDRKITGVGKDVEIGALILCWWEHKTQLSMQKTVWWFLKKLTIELPYDSAPFLGI